MTSALRLETIPPDVAVAGAVFLLVLLTLVRWITWPTPTDRRRRRPRYRRWYPRKKGSSSTEQPVATPPEFDAAEQLRCVMVSPFSKRRLLNHSEARLLAVVERAIGEAGMPWRVMAQVSLGEILASASDRAFRAINSKRVDLLVVDADTQPIAAIEYQGGGHHQGTAAARDAIKKEALRRAGIGYVEVTPGDKPADVRRLIDRLATPLPAPADVARA